jgi:hypothetical protein
MMIGTEFTVTGDATATVGYNIDNEQFGFKNEANSSIRLELVAKQGVNNGEMVGMEGWVGYIELNDFKIVIDSGDEDSTEFVTSAMVDPMMMPDVTTEVSRTGLIVTAPSIVAKLKNGPLFLQIFDAPGNEAGLVDAIENDEDEDNLAESDDQPNDVHTNLDGMGVTLGYDTADLSVALGVTSDEDYDAGTPEDNSFAISAALGVDVGPAKLDLQVVQGLAAAEDMDADADDTGVAGKLTTTFGEIALSAGADLVMTGETNDPVTAENEAMDFEIGVGADMTLTEHTMFGAKYLYSSEQDVASDVEVVLSDKNGLVDRLSMGLTWGLFDINNGAAGGPVTENDSMDMLVTGNLSYELDAMGGTLTPGAKLTLNQIDGADATVGLTVNAILTNAVPATEFGLQWKSATLFDVGEMEAEQGTITAWAKIAYS